MQDETGQALVLVDFNNVQPTIGGTATPVLHDTLELIGILVRGMFAASMPRRSRDAYDVQVRLYDGWLDRNGSRLEKCRNTSALINTVLTGISRGIRIRAEIVTSLACRPEAHLRGTYINGGQKMVDQMLAQDLQFFAWLGGYDKICLIANDDDYVPAVLASACRYDTSITWLRARGVSRNDDHLLAVHVSTLVNQAWRR